jgi:diguanylate cyclase (GGDEF)-like protein
VTAAPDRPGGARPVPDLRHEAVARDEHASILRSLTHVDWLVLLVVALYSLAPQVAPTSPRWLYTAMAAYTLFLLAFRLRSFPVRNTRARIALGAAAMVAFITVVAVQTGGSNGPMVNLYLLPIVLVAMTLGARGALVIVAGVTLAWLSVVIGEGPLPPTGELFARLFGELGPYALVAYLTQALAGSIITARRRIEEMAERDGLTGMLNVRTFKTILHREHQLRLRGAPGGYAILLVDLDRLKELNDEHGHQAGNRAITTVAGAVQRAIRTSDMAARYGGDEFVVFLPGATTEVGEIVAQRIRNNVYKSLFSVGERLQRMTVSVGTASYPRDGAQQDDIVAAAGQRARRDRELRKTAVAPADESGQQDGTDSAS